MKSWTVLLALALAVGAVDADAARLARGGSIGRQSAAVTQRHAVPAPAQRQAQPAPPPATTATPQAPRRPWGGILGGLAAGLGLAWLAHTLGLGAGFGPVLLIALVVLLAAAAMAAMRRRSQGYAYEAPGSTYDSPISPRQYNPEKIGNDASARPWESGFDPNEAGVRIGSGLRTHALEGAQQWGVPAGFDTEGFLRSAKRNFVTLQDAWDRGDVATLRGMMTDAMLGEIRKQLAERERQGGAPNQTEVVLLEAQLLGIEDTAGDYLASVEFSGMVREDPSAGPSPFREVWNMAKPKDGSAGWLVAGVQALQ